MYPGSVCICVSPCKQRSLPKNWCQHRNYQASRSLRCQAWKSPLYTKAEHPVVDQCTHHNTHLTNSSHNCGLTEKKKKEKSIWTECPAIWLYLWWNIPLYIQSEAWYKQLFMLRVIDTQIKKRRWWEKQIKQKEGKKLEKQERKIDLLKE